jgi:peptidyl-prolyl cis-trans isomerase B (cyclophilin B)
MRKILLLSALFFYSIVGIAQIGAYNGKPHYLIDTYRAGTKIGTVEVEMYPSIAPKHVRNFDSLVAARFFDTTAFHRVIPGFVIQGGDPNSRHGPKSTWGMGNPNQTDIPAEFNPISHQRGVLSAARSTDPNSANSQFFICVAAATSLDNNYTAYGKVVAGLTFVDNIVSSARDANDNPLQKIEMFITRGIVDNTTIDSVPAIIQPINNLAGISGNYLFKWKAVPGALIYNIEFASDSLFQNIVLSKSTAALSIAVSELTVGKVKYFWRMYANNGGFKSPASATRVIYTGLDAPQLLLPANASIGKSTQTHFEWRKVEQANAYRIQVSTTPAFTTSAIKLDSAGITDTFFNYNFSLTNRKYYWRIATEVNGISGLNTTSLYFTTGSTTGIENNMAHTIKQYPNPVAQILNFESSTLTGEVTLRIFDQLGKLIATQKVIPIGSTISFPIHLATGHYFYQISDATGLAQGTFDAL